MKPIKQMRSHEIASQLQMEQLQNELDKKRHALDEAMEHADQNKIKELEEQCTEIVTQIEMLDPEIATHYKDEMLKIYAHQLTKDSIMQDSFEKEVK